MSWRHILAGYSEEEKALIESLSALPLEQKIRLADPEYARNIPIDNPWFHENIARELEVPLNANHPTSSQSMVDLYTQLHNKMQNGVEAAKTQGKTFVGLIGEDHYNRNSLVIIACMLDIAERLGIQTFIDEMGEVLLNEEQPLLGMEKLQTFRWMDRIIEQDKIGDIQHPSTSWKDALLDQYHAHIIEESITNTHYLRDILQGNNAAAPALLGDPLWALAEKITTCEHTENTLRESGMAETRDHLTRMGGWGNMLDIGGSYHLQALIKHFEQPEQKEAYLYHAFDISNLLMVYNAASHLRSEEDPSLAEDIARQKFNFLDAPQNDQMEMIVMPGRGVDSPEGALNMALRASQAFDRQQGIHQRESALANTVARIAPTLSR